jgi:hypothetical protein
MGKRDHHGRHHQIGGGAARDTEVGIIAMTAARQPGPAPN